MTMTLTMARAHDDAMSDDPPASPDRPTRRHFSGPYKLAIVDEYEHAADPGAKGAILRREGLYSSHIVEWRRAREAGALAALTPRTRPSRRTPQDVELERVRRRAERAEAELAKARLVIEIQGKASALLERLLAESDEPEQSR
jgi:transposase-like protein